MRYLSNVLIIIAIMACLACSGGGGDAGQPPADGAEALNYTVYPDTAAAPELTFYWGSQKETIVPPTAVDIGKYGVWEGSGGGTSFKYGFEPATEIEMSLHSVGDPVYAYAGGTIVYKTSTDMSVRFGSKYVVKYLHLSNVDPSLAVGQTIDAGTYLGTTETMGSGYSFWEIELDYFKSDTEIVAIPPVEYFDAQSQAVFAAILTAVGETEWKLPLDAPQADGWVSYVGAYEMWADSAKCGVTDTRSYKSLGSFLAEHNLSFVLQ